MENNKITIVYKINRMHANGLPVLLQTIPHFHFVVRVGDINSSSKNSSDLLRQGSVLLKVFSVSLRVILKAA